jgi:hypothetical protein
MSFPLNKSHAAVEQSLIDLDSNQRALGYPGVQFVNTDNCCQDRKLFEKVFPSLTKPLDPPNHPSISGDVQQLIEQASSANSNRRKLPDLTPPKNIAWISSHQSCNMAIEYINQYFDSFDANREKVVGYDQEWNALKTGHPGDEFPVALIQIAPIGCDTVYLFNISTLSSTPQTSCRCSTDMIQERCDICSANSHASNKRLVLNNSLADFIAREDIIKTGFNILGDATRYRHAFGGTVYQSDPEKPSFPKESIVELRTEYEKKLGSCKSLSLAFLCSKLLGLHLAKPDLRTSSQWWGDLSSEQQQYAAKDAIASLQCYMHLRALRVPNVPNKDTPIDTLVDIYPRTGIRDINSPIARGTIVHAPLINRQSKFNISRCRVFVKLQEVLGEQHAIPFPYECRFF